MKRAFAALLATVGIVGCVAAKYAADLDSCLQYAPDHAKVVACQCAVSQANGRDCAWLDAGAQ